VSRGRVSLRTILAAVLLALGVAFPLRAQETPPQPYHSTTDHRFEDVERWKRVFDDPERDHWQEPTKVVAALEIRPGMVVADLGAGTGYFSRRLSDAVGPTGTVLAVEVEPSLVTYLRERSEREGTANVVPILASRQNPRLPAGSTDLIVLVDTFHHIDDRLGYFRSLKRSLRAGGRVAVIDWKKKELPVGPPLDHKLAREQVVEEMAAAGYVLATESTILPYQYFLVFRPN